MATRLYLPVFGVPNITPAFAAWGLTTGADRIRAAAVKTATALTSKASAAVGVTTTRDVLVRQYLSDPLSGAQTITGTVKGVIRALESATTANAQAQVTIRVVSKDGTTVRGTLLALSTAAAASEFGTTLANRKFPLAWVSPGATLSSVAAQDGDRIAIEFGSRFIATTVATTTATLNFGDNAAADATEDETGTAANNPWLEFSQTLAFQAVPELRAVGTYLTGVAGTSASMAVPAGVAADDIVLAFLYKENANAVTPPAGFTEFITVPATDHTLHGFWKRATGADSGTYTFGWTTSNWREGFAVAYSNCVTSGNPYEALATAVNNTAGTTSPGVTTAPLTDNARVLWVSTSFAGGTWTVPANYARRQAAPASSDVIMADRVWNGTGTTGAVSGSITASGRMTAALFALKPFAGGGGPPPFDPKTASMFLTM